MALRLSLLLILPAALASCGTAPPAPGGAGGQGGEVQVGDETATGGRSGQGGQAGSPADAAVARDAVAPMTPPDAPIDERPAAPDAAAVSASASEACGQGLPVPAEGIHQLMVGAMNRKFFLRLPSSYDGKKAWPVIFAFHGAGNKSAAWFDTNTDLRAQTEEKAILLFPEGATRPDGTLSWVHLSPENVLFVDAMVEWLKRTLCVDPTRLFATGQSSGGYMAMTLGCQRGHVFRAVGTSSGGILEPGTCSGGNPHVLMRTGRGDSASTQDSVVKTRDFWVKHKGCGAEPPRPIDPAPCVSYAGCGATVIYCHDGGDHGWPGFATRAMWNLFSL